MTSYKLPRATSWVLVLVAVSSLCTMLGLMRIDNIVRRDLHNYDLQFDSRWATPYWTIMRVVFALGWFNVTAALAFQLYLFVYRRKKAAHMMTDGSLMGSLGPAERTSFRGSLSTNRKIAYTVLTLGFVPLLISFFYASSVLAFVGLGLTFWGALLLYITPTQQVKVELLNATVSSILNNTEQLTSRMKPNHKGVYLPPKYLKDPEASLIFIPSKAGEAFPKPEQITDAQANDAFLTPPGMALSRLFEKGFGRSLAKTDFNYLRVRLPRILTEDLGIAENVDISKEGNMITAEIRNHIFKEICRETRKLEKTHMLTGCPLCSAIACTLAKATGNLIIIENEDPSLDGKSTRAQFKLIED